MYWIWVQTFKNGEHVASSRSAQVYVRKGNAERAAEKTYVDHGDITYKWWVSETNPWREENDG